MKNLLNIILSFIGILSLNIVLAQQYDLRFVNGHTNSPTNDKYYITVQIKATSDVEVFKIGTSAIVFDYNSAALANPVLYRSHNFDGTTNVFYLPIVAGDLINGRASLTVVYALQGSSDLYAEIVNNTWMDIITYEFDLLDHSACKYFKWRGSAVSPSPTVIINGIDAYITQGTLTNLDACPIQVLLTNFGVESKNNNVILDWTTATETNNFGFEIQRFHEKKKIWEKIDTIYSKAYNGNSSNLINYNYKDSNVYHSSMGYKAFYYRLKSIDMNSSFEYSKIISVKFGKFQFVNIKYFRLKYIFRNVPYFYSLNMNNTDTTNRKYNFSTALSSDNSKSQQIVAKQITNNENIFEEKKISIKNYPNPFIRETTFEFYITESGHVELVLYDLRGAKIQTIINGYLDQGTHKIQWINESLSKGVYLLNLSANNNNSFRKINIL